MPSVISTSPATRRQNRWIFSEKTGKITVKKFSLHGKKPLPPATRSSWRDISWATHLEDALSDLKTLSALPGRKIIVRGNHDYWWNTVSKMKRMTDNAFEFIFNSALSVENIALAGTRGWIPETSKKITEEDKVIILREQGRLERSLIEAEKFNCEKIFAILHYPPFDEQRRPTKMMEIMKSHGVTDCIYGHIHGKQNFNNLPKELEGIQLHLTSSDYLNFKPLLLTEWNES
jgi:predicted phosphohydrolase